MPTVRLVLLDDAKIFLPKGRVTPVATHLFALSLLFTLDSNKLWSRLELQQLLFGEAEKKLAAHSLRQMLYKLRRHGLEFEERPTGLRLMNVSIDGPLDRSRKQRAGFRREEENRRIHSTLSIRPPQGRAPQG